MTTDASPGEPASPAPDDKDWTWVLDRPCPDCGFDAAALERSDLPEHTRHAVAGLQSAVLAPGSTARPAPATWSALEYGCHVRDVCVIFGARLSLMRGSDNPSFANWDQDETALAEQYWTQDPETVAAELGLEGERIATAFADVQPQEWERPGRRSNGSVFTVDTLGRYFLHDLRHHLHDVTTAE
jgi:hypothetical protein